MSPKKQAIDIIGVPFDLGASCRGSRMGADALRCAGLLMRLRKLGYDVTDCGDVRLPAKWTVDEDIQVTGKGSRHQSKAKHLQEVVRINKRLCRAVAGSRVSSRIPIVLGGDHSLAIGSLAGTAQQTMGKIGVIWFDAHGDLNTIKSTPSGNIHGMSLAAALGYGHPMLTRLGGIRPKVLPEHVVLIGTRSLDPGEQELLQQTGIRVFTIREIDRLGMQEVMKQALAIVVRETEGVHLSFDMDGLDPTDAPGVGTPVAHGIQMDEALLAMREIHATGALCSADFVELNPALDLRSRTARAGVEIICALLGG